MQVVNQCVLNIIVVTLTNDFVCSVNENMLEQMKSLQFDGVSIYKMYMETHIRPQYQKNKSKAIKELFLYLNLRQNVKLDGL